MSSVVSGLGCLWLHCSCIRWHNLKTHVEIFFFSHSFESKTNDKLFLLKQRMHVKMCPLYSSDTLLNLIDLSFVRYIYCCFNAFPHYFDKSLKMLLLVLWCILLMLQYLFFSSLPKNLFCINMSREDISS